MAGTANRRAAFTPSEQYISACRELADSFGYPMREVFERYVLLVLLRQDRLGMAWSLAEWLAWRDVRDMHDRRGQQPS